MFTKPEPPSYHERLIAWWLVVLALAIFCGIIICGIVSDALAAEITIPSAAQRYRNDLTRNARLAWGLDAPIADFAAQIHQESGWRPDAKSSVGAVGLTQFMPSTATWISGVYQDLYPPEPTNPVWAMRALTTYDKHLFDRMKGADRCQQLAMALSAYNGGERYLNKAFAACKVAKGCGAPEGTKSAPRKLGDSDDDRRSARTAAVRGSLNAVALPGTDLGPSFWRMSLPEIMVRRSEAAMLPVVLTVRHDLKVEGPKVGSVAVDVVDEQTSSQRGTLDSLRDQAVNVLRSIVQVYRRITVQPENGSGGLDANSGKNIGELGSVGGGDHSVNNDPCTCKVDVWFGNVELIDDGRSPANLKQNRDYPQRILKTLAPAYVQANWGSASCSA